MSGIDCVVIGSVSFVVWRLVHSARSDAGKWDFISTMPPNYSCFIQLDRLGHS